MLQIFRRQTFQFWSPFFRRWFLRRTSTKIGFSKSISVFRPLGCLHIEIFRQILWIISPMNSNWLFRFNVSYRFLRRNHLKWLNLTVLLLAKVAMADPVEIGQSCGASLWYVSVSSTYRNRKMGWASLVLGFCLFSLIFEYFSFWTRRSVIGFTVWWDFFWAIPPCSSWNYKTLYALHLPVHVYGLFCWVHFLLVVKMTRFLFLFYVINLNIHRVFGDMHWRIHEIMNLWILFEIRMAHLIKIRSVLLL